MRDLEHRPYEQEAVRALRALLPKHRRVLAVGPTGSGKTVIGAMLLDSETRWRRVLWLAHRIELIEHARSQIVGLGIDCGVRCASYEQLHPEHVNHAARVQVGSIQTVTRRELDDIDLIIIDEAHRAMADTYQNLVRLHPEAEVLGLTATPLRTDGRALGDFFRVLHVIARPSALYAGGYLVEPITGPCPQTSLPAHVVTVSLDAAFFLPRSDPSCLLLKRGSVAHARIVAARHDWIRAVSY